MKSVILERDFCKGLANRRLPWVGLRKWLGPVQLTFGFPNICFVPLLSTIIPGNVSHRIWNLLNLGGLESPASPRKRFKRHGTQRRQLPATFQNKTQMNAGEYEILNRWTKYCNSLAYVNEYTHRKSVDIYSLNKHSSFFDRSSTFNSPVGRILLWRQRLLTSCLILEGSSRLSAHWTTAAFNTGGNIEFTTWAHAINREKRENNLICSYKWKQSHSFLKQNVTLFLKQQI